MFRLRIKRKQLRVIENLSEPVKGHIRDALNVLKVDPVPVKSYDIKKIQGYDSVYRIRVGKSRILYSVDWAEKIISIHYVGSRKKAYR